MMVMVQGHERGSRRIADASRATGMYFFLYSRCVYYLLVLFLGITYEILMGKGSVDKNRPK